MWNAFSAPSFIILSDRTATITFHFSAVAFVSFVPLQTCNRYLPGDLKGQSVPVQITVCMRVSRDFKETPWHTGKLQTLLKPSDPDRSTKKHPIMYLFVHFFFFVTGHLHIWMLGYVFFKGHLMRFRTQNKLLIFICCCLCNWFGWTIHIWPTCGCSKIGCIIILTWRNMYSVKVQSLQSLIHMWCNENEIWEECWKSPLC